MYGFLCGLTHIILFFFYGDDTYFINISDAWLYHGSPWHSGFLTGAFSFGTTLGISSYYRGSRLLITII